MTKTNAHPALDESWGSTARARVRDVAHPPWRGALDAGVAATGDGDAGDAPEPRRAVRSRG